MMMVIVAIGFSYHVHVLVNDESQHVGDVW